MSKVVFDFPVEVLPPVLAVQLKVSKYLACAPTIVEATASSDAQLYN